MADEIVAASEILQGAVDDRTEAAIAEAAASVERAHATAQAITDAALQTELGRRIDAQNMEISTWKNQMELHLSSVQRELEELRARQEAPPSAVVVAPLSSIPEPSPEPEAPKAIQPGSVNADGLQGQDENPPEPKRTAKRRVI